MHKISGFLAGMLSALTLMLIIALPCMARTDYTNPDTGYEVHIDDDAGLLTDDELAKLSSQMQAITEWGDVAFVTTAYNPSSADDYARNYSYSHFGQGSSTLFLIDMDNRIYIQQRLYI